MNFFRLHFLNDLKQIEEKDLFSKVKTYTHFSFSFIFLLVASGIVCTLGLLLNSPAIVIGGMVISPLMWPLMKISLGISYEMKSYVRQATVLSLYSILIVLFSAYVITLISPIKGLNEEILARTNPTLLNLFIAFAAGSVAAFGLIQPRVSETLAGVAIAVSLMPPLCVAGIGLALLNTQVFFGGLILFLANVVAIVFISTLTFIISGVTRSVDNKIKSRGILITTISLLIIALPLFVFLRTYSFQINAHSQVQSILTTSVKEISSAATVEDIKTDVGGLFTRKAFGVEAEILIPENVSINYLHRQDIAQSLERALGRKVDLNLRIQRTIAVVDEKNFEESVKKEKLKDELIVNIKHINVGFSVDSVEVSNDAGWDVKAVLRGDPALTFTQIQRESLEKILSDSLGEPVTLNLEITSLVKLYSRPDLEAEEMKFTAENLLAEKFPWARLSSFQVSGVEGDDDNQITKIALEVKVLEGFTITDNFISSIKSALELKYNKFFLLTLRAIEEKEYVY